MKDSDLASRIGELVGGPGNVQSVTHCATRLRFVLKDEKNVRKDDLTATKGVVQVVESGGQTQVVIGPGVGEVYQALVKTPGWGGVTGDAPQAGDGKRQSFFDWLFGLLSGTFQPLLMPLLGSSMLLMIYGLGRQFAWFDPDAPGVVWSVLHAACNAFFYFLPIFVAATATRKLGGSPYLGATIAAALLHPSFTGLGAAGDAVDFIGIPLYLYDYSSSVFPALLIAIAVSRLEPFLRRILPKNLHLVLVPTISIALLVPLAILVIGPIGVALGNGVLFVVQAASDFSPILLGVVFGALFIVLVIFGLHWALVPINLVNIAAGGDPLTALAGSYNFAVWGLALAIVLRAPKGSDLREMAGAGAISGLVAGISEPMLYGVILRYKRVLPMIVVSAAIGGGVMGAFQVEGHAFALSSLLTIPLMTPQYGYIIGIGTSFLLMFFWVLIFGYEGKKAVSGAEADVVAGTDLAEPAARPAAVDAPLTLLSPLTGRVIPLGEVPDPVFASESMGSGVAIVPTDGTLVAPCDGTVIAVLSSGHAVGLRTPEGAEILIHVGIDTVNLGGRGFTVHVEQEQEVVAGQPLLDVDLDVVRAAGYSLATPVVLTNASELGEVTTAAQDEVLAGQPLLLVAPAREVAPGA